MGRSNSSQSLAQPPGKSPAAWCRLALLAAALVAVGPTLAMGAAESGFTGAWYQFLIPQAFTPNPQLEMSAFTEFTPAGRKLAAVSPDRPVYYVAQDQGYQPKGDVVAGDHPPEGAGLTRFMRQALANRGYLPAGDESHPPGLALVFYWGSHYALDPEMAGMFSELAERHLQERASLVGGRRYAHQLNLQMAFGTSLADRSAKKDFLRHQSARDLYYVVVSAYDFKDLARGEHRLLWRTTLTVGANGVSMRESLPPLILTGGEYFGRAMDDTVALRRAVRRGTVNLGPLRIIESDFPEEPRRHHRRN